MMLAELREQVVQVGLDALDLGIVFGTAGNMSIRDPESGLIAISPSGIPYRQTTAADVVIVDQWGKICDGHRKPSSETPMHTAAFRHNVAIRAVVHTHSHYSTVVGTIRQCLPPILTEAAIGVGCRVPVTRYGKTGTSDMADSVTEVMEPDTKAVIMKNHGLIVFGADFADALSISAVVEESAKVYIHALAANGGREPDLVPIDLVPAMLDHYHANYGQRA